MGTEARRARIMTAMSLGFGTRRRDLREGGTEGNTQKEAPRSRGALVIGEGGGGILGATRLGLHLRDGFVVQTGAGGAQAAVLRADLAGGRHGVHAGADLRVACGEVNRVLVLAAVLRQRGG